MYVKQTINAGQRLEFIEASDFFRLLAAQNVVNVEFYRNGAEIAEVFEIGAGYAERVPEGFDKVVIVSTVTQTIQFVTRQGAEVRYDTPPNGNVIVTNTGGAFTHQVSTVTNASGQLRAANAARRYLLIQNNDASGDVFIRLDGATATVANGIKIAAGQALELTNYAPTGAITAIGSIVSNANVIVVEG